MGTEWVTRADRALGFDLQVVAEALGRLLDGFGGHKGVSNPGRASSDRDQLWLSASAGDRLHGRRLRGDIDRRLLGCRAQKAFDILQRLGR